MPKLEVLEDEIGRKLAEAARTGELQSARGWGKPFEHDPGWEQTPEEFRLAFKMLKNAGIVPPEVELLHERSRLHAAVARAHTDDERRLLQRELSELEQKLALRLEALRVTGAL